MVSQCPKSFWPMYQVFLVHDPATYSSKPISLAFLASLRALKSALKVVILFCHCVCIL